MPKRKRKSWNYENIEEYRKWFEGQTKVTQNRNARKLKAFCEWIHKTPQKILTEYETTQDKKAWQRERKKEVEAHYNYLKQKGYKINYCRTEPLGILKFHTRHTEMTKQGTESFDDVQLPENEFVFDQPTLTGSTNVNPAFFSTLTFLQILFLVAGIISVIVLFYVNKYEQPKRLNRIRQRFAVQRADKASIPTTPSTVTIAQTERDAWTFFMGAIVGVEGSLLVTSIFEFAKLTLPNGVGYAVFYWGLVFLISSIVFFWLIKKTLVRIGINVSSRPFIVATAICIVLGIFMITLGILAILNIQVIVK